MAKINPAQVALIKEMQPEFNFQERKVFPTEDPVTTKGAGDTDLGNDDDDGNSFTDKSMTDILGLNGKKSSSWLKLPCLLVTMRRSTFDIDS